MLLKFSLLARPARVTSEKLELDDTGKGGGEGGTLSGKSRLAIVGDS